MFEIVCDNNNDNDDDDDERTSMGILYARLVRLLVFTLTFKNKHAQALKCVKVYPFCG